MNKLSCSFFSLLVFALSVTLKSTECSRSKRKTKLKCSDEENKLYPTAAKKPNSYCHRELDLTILVDESSSISELEWAKLIPFLKSLVHSIKISPTYVHLALVTYSTSTRWLIGFTDPASKDEKLALSKIDLLKESKPAVGFTYTGQGLDFVREVVLGMGARKNAPKAIILITDGGSSQPNVTSQASAMLRNDGVTLLVVGVGQARRFECRAIAGCQMDGECPYFFETNWDDIIRKVGELMVDVCETIPKDAVCNPHYSDWSPCNVKCGKGERFRKLMSVSTVTDATIGTNGKSGRTCEEQFKEVEEPKEECEGPCEDDVGGNPEPLAIESGSDPEDPEQFPENPGEYDDTDEYEKFNNKYEEVPDDLRIREEQIRKNMQEKGMSGNSQGTLDNFSRHESTHEDKNEEKKTKNEEFRRSGAKIAGGVILGLLMVGAGGGYAFYKKKKPSVDLEAPNEENFGEAGEIPHSQEGETYTVPDLDDGLWSQSQ